MLLAMVGNTDNSVHIAEKRQRQALLALELAFVRNLALALVLLPSTQLVEIELAKRSAVPLELSLENISVLSVLTLAGYPDTAEQRELILQVAEGVF